MNAEERRAVAFIEGVVGQKVDLASNRSYVDYVIAGFREAEQVAREDERSKTQWRPIETAPKDGTFIVLLHPRWDRAEIGKWDWCEGPDEKGKNGFCLWHLRDDTSGAMGDGLLWPGEEWRMPTHWAPLP